MDEDFKAQALDSTLQSPSETLLSIRLLDFKTSLLEAIEELRIRRETETNYEDQINKIVVEKQELEWQKETLQHQTDTLQQQNKEAMAAFKKQLQARMFAMEEEKGKYQLAVETKEKEIDGLKETLKALQISKYTLQKKLNEMDQKLQMHLTAKEEHHKKLNEVERCYATIASQFGIIKGVHGKLEHSVQEAIQHNKKLTAVNKRQETEISNLKEELKKVTTDLIRSKVTSQYRVGEENINLAAKEKQFQELQQKIRMETAVSKKIQEENTHIKEEKLEILSSLQCVQELLQRITQMNARMESELNALKEEYQALERDNELQREKAKENEEKFLNLQNEHEKALRTWKKDEENMRREIDTIKNELNSLKGLHGHPEDYHLPQGNQQSEQVKNLQMHSAVQPVPTNMSGQEQSKDSEIQAIQKENEFIQSVIRKYGNCGHEEETEVKTTRDHSSNTEELQTEQNLQVLENSSKDEINVASACEEKQREASPRNTLCTDTDLITQGQSSEMHVTGSKEAENPGATQRMLLDENNTNLEQKPQASTEPLAGGHTQRKAFLDSTEPVGADKKNGNQETNSSKQELCNATAESTSAKADTKSDTIQHSKSVLTPEAFSPEPEVVLCTEKNSLCERSTGDHQAKELSFGILPYTKESSQTEYQKCSLLTSDNYVGNRLHRTEKNLNWSGFHKLPLKQIHADAEDRNDARNINTNGALGSSGVPATDAQNLPTVYGDNASGDDAVKEHSDNMSVLATFNLCPPKTERGINAGDMPSKQPEQDTTKQTGNATNPSTSNAETTPPVKADGLEIAHKKPPTDRAGTDKLIPCKKINDDTQMHSIKSGHSLEINNSTNNTLLKEKKDLLNSTVPGRKFAEGHLKESCSLPMRTSGNLVNISGRSSFDLSTSDKKAEKTPLYFNFLDLGSCSRVNQMRGQATWTSASKEPSLLKLPCLVENTKVISKTQCQNLSENVDAGETGQGSTSSNRATNTLNTSNIHQDPQGDPSEEWNATAKTFYDSSFPTEHVKEGFAALQQKQKSFPVTVTPARSEKAPRDEDSSALQNSIIQNQIETEKFLNLEILHSARKRKYEEGQ
ncbi:coiled-coil domain-containing protein 73 isoform X1 [Pipra filicauda]|uniref:Coiled-coil domain-containing protein 73 isoform X1 n=2 Tax=Pipra filicauda TaxID=649802 RepID=A0A6J2HW02_9PASS|nr:coiled-coil domain-containing protein 73 isoform X1 [Pipra filicauda]XP_027591570.2 coiled-coil domain-containing protein 73 isoform X1 [Pipra filicauda]XP_027591572.2 coiled-coil domain-containing protein 73 isoform X1 [Pipra filicauda]XP_027591582.2 coiled-coil domain-containing protein 73 isoform X1 [Pipra filicauda]